ncbi:hypothetical protein Tco_0875895 [Tanacetum coccineum]|uniref:Uncharacterized protein n=1 Tax=Tanacetum coccineum TaxID=301880 RepID=A0ABQ5BVR9_9ASTR
MEEDHNNFLWLPARYVDRGPPSRSLTEIIWRTFLCASFIQTSFTQQGVELETPGSLAKHGIQRWVEDLFMTASSIKANIAQPQYPPYGGWRVNMNTSLVIMF